ncbi:uncharacterized protein LOC129770932 isoform X2 [Toxorhynchites rutilus septentrionalis]|uniref:uncharacterized protein LOC129770932 isoform X2 n=1 Tax=Toxorhynchites rutilus septentrionalis TaxID=329112 RepID=UPI0024797976|nr:uncharacterized protein LOC129770932 isoform X2 [Toxorhynchites rutilus septentrionalis]
MNKLAFSISLLLVLSSMHVPPIRATVIRLFTELLQNNVAGIPLIHKTEEFDFDPEVSKKRRELYYEILSTLLAGLSHYFQFFGIMSGV